MSFKEKENLKIGELAKDTGLPVSTLQYYARLGLLKEIYRTPGGVRIFDGNKSRRKLKTIKEKNGTSSLKKIKELLKEKKGA